MEFYGTIVVRSQDSSTVQLLPGCKSRKNPTSVQQTTYKNFKILPKQNFPKMMFLALVALAVVGVAQCYLNDVVKCLAVKENCEAIQKIQSSLDVLTFLGFNTSTCTLPVVTYSSSEESSNTTCPIKDPFNTVITCTVTANPGVKPFDPMNFCYPTNLTATGSCDDIDKEFITYADGAKKDCEAQDTKANGDGKTRRRRGGQNRRRRSALRPEFFVSF